MQSSKCPRAVSRKVPMEPVFKDVAHAIVLPALTSQEPYQVLLRLLQHVLGGGREAAPRCTILLTRTLQNSSEYFFNLFDTILPIVKEPSGMILESVQARSLYKDVAPSEPGTGPRPSRCPARGPPPASRTYRAQEIPRIGKKLRSQ